MSQVSVAAKTRALQDLAGEIKRLVFAGQVIQPTDGKAQEALQTQLDRCQTKLGGLLKLPRCQSAEPEALKARGRRPTGAIGDTKVRSVSVERLHSIGEAMGLPAMSPAKSVDEYYRVVHSRAQELYTGMTKLQSFLGPHTAFGNNQSADQYIASVIGVLGDIRDSLKSGGVHPETVPPRRGGQP